MISMGFRGKVMIVTDVSHNFMMIYTYSMVVSSFNLKQFSVEGWIKALFH